MKIIYAWDEPTPEATALLPETEAVFGLVDGVKIGVVVWTAMGHRALRQAAHYGVPIFLDLKFHDIPNTVEGAVRAACDLGVAMLNVHASGGREMMEAAAKAAEGYPDTKVIAVTLLTSQDERELGRVGLSVKPALTGLTEWLTPEMSLVRGMAVAACESGLDGVVCSANEAEVVREVVENFLIVCPAIRPDWSVPKDQKRPTSPLQAKAMGATHIVLGRAVSSPPGEIPVSEEQAIKLMAVGINVGLHLRPEGGLLFVPGTPQNALALIRQEIDDV